MGYLKKLNDRNHNISFINDWSHLHNIVMMMISGQCCDNDNIVMMIEVTFTLLC